MLTLNSRTVIIHFKLALKSQLFWIISNDLWRCIEGEIADILHVFPAVLLSMNIYIYILEPLNKKRQERKINVKGEGERGVREICWNTRETTSNATLKKIKRMQKCKQNKTPYIPVGITYQTNYAVDDESRELNPL